MNLPDRLPFQTIAEFQEVHEALMLRLDQVEIEADVMAEVGDAGGSGDDRHAERERQHLLGMFPDVAAFLQRGAAGGAYLDETRERRACQAMLDYWAGRCYSHGLDVTRPLLVPHDHALLPQLADDACPYLGLAAFGESDAKHFFGRDDQIAALVERLRRQRLLVVTGASGSGKSSLVLAGLVPALRSAAVDGSAGWIYPSPLTPGVTPLRQLAHALAHALALAADGGAREPDDAAIADHAAQLLRHPAHAVAMLSPLAQPVLLVVDQFEEALTLRTEQTSAAHLAFVAALCAVVDAPGPGHRVVATMRKDVEPQLAREYPDLNRRYGEAEFSVYSMEAARLREAIERPAQQVGLKFQAGLVDDLIKSVVGEDASLPLLQFSLTSLWARRKGNLITRDAYREVGSPRQAMAEAAKRVYENELSREQQLAAQKVFLALSRPGEAASVFRSRATRRVLQGVADATNVEAVLDKFVRARLVRLTPAASGDPLDDVAEVAHESLLRNWDLLDHLFAEQRVERERRAFLRKQAEKWREGGFDKAFVLGGLALEQANAEFDRAAITPLEREFLDASDAAELALRYARADEEAKRIAVESERADLAEARARIEAQAAADQLHANRRIAKRLRWATIAAFSALGLFVLAILGWIATSTAQKQAEREKDRAKEEAVALLGKARAEAQVAYANANEAQVEARKISDDAVKTGEEAVRVSQLARQQAATAQQQTAAARAATGKAERQRDDTWLSMLASRAGSVAAVNAEQSLALVNDVAEHDPARQHALAPAVIEATQYRWATQLLTRDLLGPVEALVLAADGQHLLVAGPGGVDEWELGLPAFRPQRHLGWDTLEDRPAAVRSVAYGQDGRQVAAATDIGVVLWQASTASTASEGAAPPRVLGRSGDVGQLNFSPDGRLLAGITADAAELRVWSLDDGRLLFAQRPKGAQADTEPAPMLMSTAFRAGGKEIVVAQRPAWPGLDVQLLSYSTEGDGAATGSAGAKLCKDFEYAFAQGGSTIGVSMMPQVCLLDLQRLQGERRSPYQRIDRSESGGVDDIIIDRDGRRIVKLLRGTAEVQVSDLVSGGLWRLQGAFDMPARGSYESLVSLSEQGNRLAIQAADGAVRVYDFRPRLRPLGDRVAPWWVSRDETRMLTEVRGPAGDGLELRRLRDGQVLRRLETPDLHDAVPRIGVSANESQLVLESRCGEPVRPCLTGFDLASGRQISQHRHDGVIDRADDLRLVRDAREWILYTADEQPVFRMAAAREGERARVTPLASSLVLGHSRLFATKTVLPGGTVRIEVQAIERGVPRVLRRIERDAPQGLNIALPGGGRMLQLSDARHVELWDLGSQASTPALTRDLLTRETFAINEATGLVAWRTSSGWELFERNGSAVRDAANHAVLLRREMEIDPTGRHAFGKSEGGDGLEVRRLDDPAAPPIVLKGWPAQPVFSRSGAVMAVRLPQQQRMRFYRLPSTEPVLETDLQLFSAAPLPSPGEFMDQLTPQGGYMVDRNGRLVPTDVQRVMEEAQAQASRDLDPGERCRLLGAPAGCLGTKLSPRRASSSSR
jgi:energy-coupling factor transporter ATP-binding protein EcfA2